MLPRRLELRWTAAPTKGWTLDPASGFLVVELLDAKAHQVEFVLN